jgi:hypothetical protein
MFTNAHARIYVEVHLENDKFVAEDGFSRRGRDGKHGEVEIQKVSTTMSQLARQENDQIWGDGHRLRADGTVGSRHTSNVLLDESQVPAHVLRALRLAYLAQVKAMALEAGFLSD